MKEKKSDKSGLGHPVCDGGCFIKAQVLLVWFTVMSCLNQVVLAVLFTLSHYILIYLKSRCVNML